MHQLRCCSLGIAESTGVQYLKALLSNFYIYFRESIHRAMEGQLPGQCRCHMGCLCQGGIENGEEPYIALAKISRIDGRGFFGRHASTFNPEPVLG